MTEGLRAFGFCHLHDEAAAMPQEPGLVVFISSPCYDLPDIRFGLQEHLRTRGCAVRLSEDPGSAFHVDPDENSIQTCVENAVSSDAVLCIFDREYGPPLPEAFEHKSATHYEIDKAREAFQHNPRKHVFYFFRQEAWDEYSRYKNDINSDGWKWVERRDPVRRSKWVEWVRELMQIHDAQSNWRDTFKSLQDLKVLVDKRLHDAFPNYRAAPALGFERLVRLTFVPSAKWRVSAGDILGHFRNESAGIGLHLRHGWSTSRGRCDGPWYRGALGPKESVVALADGKPFDWLYNLGRGEVGEKATVYCEYENSLGDRYRVSLLFDWTPDGKHINPQTMATGKGQWRLSGGERFFLAVNTADGQSWSEVSEGPRPHGNPEFDLATT